MGPTLMIHWLFNIIVWQQIFMGLEISKVSFYFLKMCLTILCSNIRPRNVFDSTVLLFIWVSENRFICLTPYMYIVTSVVCSCLAVLHTYMNGNAFASDPSMHDCTYTCVCPIHTHACMHACVCMYVHMYTHLYTYAHIPLLIIFLTCTICIFSLLHCMFEVMDTFVVLVLEMD